MLDDSQWGAASLDANRLLLIEGVLARFKAQNAKLRACLRALEPDLVNKAVFDTLDRFDRALDGHIHDEQLRLAVSRMFSDFSSMCDPNLRHEIAGGITGSTGTDYVEHFGYINALKEHDAAVQWSLFMPDTVKKQQNGFNVDSFTCKKMPAIRFIGRELSDVPDEDANTRSLVFKTLDTMAQYHSGFDYDLLFMHHYGKNVDVGPWHGFWGRFMKADTPVPEGFISFDLIPQNNQRPGLPFLSEFTFAVFSGDLEAMHRRQGYDSDAMYDVTRNIMLGQDILIPYPDKYWTAEVFLNGVSQPSTAYLFSAELF